MKAKDPSQEELMEAFEIRERKLWRKEYVDTLGRKQGGFVEIVANHSEGYCQVAFRGRNVFYHRIVYILIKGPIEDGKQIDHIDRNKLNNDISNLRAVSHSENSRNKEVYGEIKVRGVYYNKKVGKLMARVWHKGKNHYGGLHNTVEEAAEAVRKLEERLGIIR